eukprot:4339528-Alexandrium_andersonii.AAC.1
MRASFMCTTSRLRVGDARPRAQGVHIRSAPHPLAVASLWQFQGFRAVSGALAVRARARVSERASRN